MKLIDKDALVAEIDRLQETTMDENRNFLSSYHEGVFDGLSMLENFLDTLEVKDVDEIIKNAEDHAYFAGSENAREKLIDKACKWLEVELIFPSMTSGEIKLYKNRVRKFRKDILTTFPNTATLQTYVHCARSVTTATMRNTEGIHVQ